MVKNHGKLYIAFMVKCSVLIDLASIVKHGIFDLVEHGILHSCFHGQTFPFLVMLLPWDME